MEKQKSVPLYRQVAETIRGRILGSLYKQGELIPPLRELEAEFRVSNITIRKALALLHHEGLIDSRQGVGTLVAKNAGDLEPIEISGDFKEWLETASGKRTHLSAEVLEMKYAAAPPRVNEILDVQPDEKLFRLKRIRKYNEQPVSYFINYSPHSGCRNIKKRDVVQRTFLEVFQDVCAVRLTHIEQRVQAVTADLDLSSILDIEFGAPVFFAENIYFAEDKRPVQVTHMYYRGDRYIYKATISLPDQRQPN